VLPTLDEQLDEILPRITGILSDAGTAWDQVINVSGYLHRSQPVEALIERFNKRVKVPIPRMEIAFVDGYSAEGKLIEIEVTAELK
jgi:enamine deaminase RidA (YjgF/YER057c/UK114 family)